MRKQLIALIALAAALLASDLLAQSGVIQDRERISVLGSVHEVNFLEPRFWTARRSSVDRLDETERQVRARRAQNLPLPCDDASLGTRPAELSDQMLTPEN
jgi:hypothetical protein